VGVDVRVLSAAHKSLSRLVAEGKFREDLFYLVNVIELCLRYAKGGKTSKNLPSPRCGASVGE
jgi:transcriptional regulator of aromatic amino acid metabolism